MPQLALDPAATARLRAVDGPTELIDAEGVAYATLTPLAAPPLPDLTAGGWTEEEIAEAKHRARSGERGRPTEDVFGDVFGENWRTRYGVDGGES